MVVSLACEKPQKPAKPAPALAQIERPAAELVGCRHRVRQRCHLAEEQPAELRVWLDLHGGAELMIEIDGVPVPRDSHVINEVDGGLQLRLEIPPSARQLVISGRDPTWTESWTLDFERDPIPEAVKEARALANPQLAIEHLRAALGTLENEPRLEALQLLRRISAASGDPLWPREAERAAELARQLGRHRDLAECAAALVFAHATRQEFLAASEWAQELERLAIHGPEERIWASYSRGLLASRSGDLGTAVRSLENARSEALRVDAHVEFVGASEMLGVALAELGRGAEAHRLIGETLALVSSEPQCEQRARIYANSGWASLLLAEAGFEHHDPRRLLERQFALIGEGGECPNTGSARIARVNSALAALADEEYEDAWDWIAPLHLEQTPLYLRPWVDEVVAQIGVGTGRWEWVPPIVQRPDPGHGESSLRWNAVLRHARVLESAALYEAARIGYGEAEDLLSESLSSIGVDHGQELFLAGRQASAVGLVRLLIGEGRVEEALCRARLARGRALRSLDRSSRISALSSNERADREELLFRYLAIQTEVADARREDWSFSASERDQREQRRAERLGRAEALLDEALRVVGSDAERERGETSCASLPSIVPGEVMLMQFPRPDGSWLFVADAEGVDVLTLPDPRVETWSPQILAEHAARLRGAQLIRVVPTARAWAIPFHALEFGEGVLLDLAPVVYSLDLSRPPTDLDSIGDALIIADPRGDLEAARLEAAHVETRLAELGWRVERHEAGQATREVLMVGLHSADLFHYAGHGVHRGADGWRAALLLHDGDDFSVSDVLALPHVPAGVVLSGCETATLADATLAGGMNLGRAFVLAGSSWVIAAEGEVPDELAQRVGEMLYADFGSTSADGPAALRRVQLALRADPEGAGWESFRVVVP